jgi:hypothetical protein
MPELNEKSLQRRHLEEVVDSHGYKLIWDRIQLMISRHQARLENDLDPIETANVRGQLKALRDALGVPQILAEEYQKK